MLQMFQKLHIRLSALLLAILLCVCSVPAAYAVQTGGKCGDALEWTLSGDTLTITGSGAMYDYNELEMAPWYPYRKEISTLILPDGLTRVGDLAFYECSALRAVRLPDSVQEVGWFSFGKCTGLILLDLGNRLRVIGNSAFRECSSLTSVRLPNSLITLSFQAFYRCESLTEITIPASVTDMGMTTFAYCYDLVRATVLAPVDKLPDWTFYGCEKLTDVVLPASVTGVNKYAFYDCKNLNSVEYSGSAANGKQIKEDIVRDLEGKGAMISVTASETPPSTTSTVIKEDGGDIVAETITATRTENAAISSEVKVVYPGGDVDNSQSAAQVNVTLENSTGWTEITEEILAVTKQTTDTTVDIYVKDNSAAPAAVLDTLAGQDVTVRVQTASGAVWQTDCAELPVTNASQKDGKQNQNENKQYDFSYERLPANEDQAAAVGGTANYQILFAAECYINAEVMIKLPVEHARQRATLYQVVRNDLEPLQATLVDDEGYAHFYLGRVDSETVYLIGINVQQNREENEEETAVETVIPTTLQADYGVTERIAPVQYVLTGRKSSWGMNINQVTWILVGGMFLVIAVVGVTMFLLNKRKLKMGYVPDLGDDDE